MSVTKGEEESYDGYGLGDDDTLWSFNTTMPPSIWALKDDFLAHRATRFVLVPRCFSRAFCAWPCRTASVVPMMAGQAAMDVRIPSTMLLAYTSNRRMKL